MLNSITDYFIALLTFCVILFIYIHIQFHLRTSNDLEVYELEQTSKNVLEEICDIMQPTLIDISSEPDLYKIIQTTNKDFLLANYPMFDIKIRNVNDINNNNDIMLPLNLELGNKLFNEDSNASYYSEGNTDFLQETASIKNMTYNDYFLRPYLVSNCYYDFIIGSKNVETPLRYDINYRNYYMVTQGSIKIKLTPPNSSKYLYPIKDYESLEFKSPINPWEPQQKYKADFDKIKCLELTLNVGQLLYIPAYWWYSFKFDENSSVSCLKYRTYMNNIAISPHIFMYALQNQNIQRKIANIHSL
jgi:hypothetical protein